MFDIETSYAYRRVGTHSKTTTQRKHVEWLHVYSFSTEKAKYLIDLERYSEHIYIVKFYKRAHKGNKERFNLLTNEGRCSRIVATCLSIFVDILEIDKYACFGFIGANTIDPKREIYEPKYNTKRYAIYTQALLARFGEKTFTYFDNPVNSFYLAVSNENKDVYKIADKAAYILSDLLES